MKTLFARFVKNEFGATAIEYGLIASLIAVAAITAMTAVGTSLSEHVQQRQRQALSLARPFPGLEPARDELSDETRTAARPAAVLVHFSPTTRSPHPAASGSPRSRSGAPRGMGARTGSPRAAPPARRSQIPDRPSRSRTICRSAPGSRGS